jgi:endonuclease/exonuclease/phosphatase (EEP) superfamily protein YafD
VWLIDGALNFAPYAGPPLLLALLVVAVFRRWRWTLVACTPLLIWAAFMTTTRMTLALGQDCVDEPALRVVTANVLYTNTELAALADQVLAEAPDVVVFEELQQELDAFSPALAATYPYRISTDTPWVTLASRLPLENPRRLTLAEAIPGREPLTAQVHVAGQVVTVLAVHEVVPIDAATYQQHAAQYAALGDEIRRAPGPVLAIGDFNSTVYSPGFLHFLAGNALRAASGSLMQLPTHFPHGEQLAVRIDQVLLRDFDVCGEQVFNLTGSDHRGLAVDVRLNKPARTAELSAR